MKNQTSNNKTDNQTTSQNTNDMNNLTLYHFIVDKSGSMAGMEAATIQGFNQQLETIQHLKNTMPDQKFRCSLTFFDSTVQHLILDKSVKYIHPLSAESYYPGGMTALLDAIGDSIQHIEMAYEKKLRKRKMSVVMVIITDGHENASRSFSYQQIAKKIGELDKTGLWTFTYLGADFDAIQASDLLNIRKENVMNFSKDNYDGMMFKLKHSINEYASMKHSGTLKKDLMDLYEKKDIRDEGDGDSDG